MISSGAEIWCSSPFCHFLFSFIPVNKLGHLLKLADEYQANAVLDLCVKCLKHERKTTESAVEILYLTTHTVIAREDGRLEDVRKECYDLIKNMELADIRGKSDYKNLERESLENVLAERIEVLETFLKGIYPQFIGLVECCLWAGMLLDKDCDDISPCPQHFKSGKSKVDLLQRIKYCSVCRNMIVKLVSFLQIRSYRYGSDSSSTNYKYGGPYHFDGKLIAVIQDFQNIIGGL